MAPGLVNALTCLGLLALGRFLLVLGVRLLLFFFLLSLHPSGLANLYMSLFAIDEVLGYRDQTSSESIGDSWVGHVVRADYEIDRKFH